MDRAGTGENPTTDRTHNLERPGSGRKEKAFLQRRFPSGTAAMSKERTRAEVIFGRHPVLQALQAGRPVQRLVIARGAHGPAVDEIFALARHRRISCDLRERSVLDRAVGARHQGVVAYLAARLYADFSDLLLNLDRRRAFLVFLDLIQDPHNLGAIIRSAHAVQADGVVLQERNAAGLSAAAVKAAAGAAEHVPLCQVSNLRRALQQASKAGLWVVGLEPEAEQSFTDFDFSQPSALVIGGEARGLRRLIRETCDLRVRIPMARREVGSFNASVAAGLVLYEVFRQRSAGGGT